MLSFSTKNITGIHLVDFFYNTYKSTPKEKLLEFMKDSKQIDLLRELPQEELSKVYCEGLVYTAIREPRK